MITVYYTNFETTLPENVFSAHLASLPVEIKNRLLKFKRWEDAHASLFGKLLLKKGLTDLGMNGDLSDLTYSDYGRPYFEHLPDFNISHSGQHVVCAFAANGKIGIDVEQVQPVCFDTFKNIFNDEEWRHIKGAEDSNKEFFYYWSAKESIVKADGRGINIPLKTIHFSNGVGSLEGSTWYVNNISLNENCVTQVASSEMIHKISIHKINFHD